MANPGKAVAPKDAKAAPKKPRRSKELDRMRSSMVNIRIGNRSYPAVRANMCGVCTHPARALIEERLLYNDTYPALVAWVSGRESEDINGVTVPWPELSIAQLMGHYNNGHCPVDTKVLHELTEQRAAEIGVGYEQSTARIVDHVVLTQQIASRGQERMMRGEIEPGVKETLAAAKLLYDMQSASAAGDAAVTASSLEELIDIYFTETKKIMTEEQWSLLSTTLNRHSGLRAIVARFQPSDTVDAEVVR